MMGERGRGQVSSEIYPPTGGMGCFVARVLGELPVGRALCSTGLSPLDRVLGGGLRAGQVTIVAGVAGVGTSIFALGLARCAALHQGLRTAYVAPDADSDELLARVVAAELAINVGKVRRGVLSEEQQVRVRDARARLERAPLWINAGFSTLLTSDVAIDTVGYMTDFEAVRLVVVDGTSQMEPRVRDLVRGLRVMAQERQCAVVVTSKLASIPDAVGEAPRLVDLWESEAVADLADSVLVVTRPSSHAAQARGDDALLYVVKHRYGAECHLPLAFQGHYARFVEVVQG